MKTKPKPTKGLQEINVFQFERGNQGAASLMGTIKRIVHKASAVYPERDGCAQSPLRSRSYFWITLFRKSRQKWPVYYQEEDPERKWLTPGWYLCLPSDVNISTLWR